MWTGRDVSGMAVRGGRRIGAAAIEAIALRILLLIALAGRVVARWREKDPLTCGPRRAAQKTPRPAKAGFNAGLAFCGPHRWLFGRSSSHAGENPSMATTSSNDTIIK